MASVKRRHRKWPPDILAVKQFIKAMEQVRPYARDAAIKYLADRYLGVKLWRQS